MSTIKLKKPMQRWLFGGIGFHNSEATMTPIMTDTFKNERVLKSFAEISPTFSRVFGGYADWTKDAMDRFADYYDKTFRKSGTLLYLVPGRLPYITKDFDIEKHAEDIAKNLDYLINEKKCTKIRYYCITNELSVGNSGAWLEQRLDLFKELHDALYRAFKRHGLGVGLVATDASGAKNFWQVKWAVDNMDEITDAYCTHLYQNKYAPGDLHLYDHLMNLFSGAVGDALSKQKRYILGEFGITTWAELGVPWSGNKIAIPMINDVPYSESVPGSDGICAVALAEMAIAIVNSGTLAGVYWTMFDYPDPFLIEDGDTAEEKAKYDVSRFSGHGLGIRYNKHGLIRWNDDDKNYSGRAALYTLGYMAKLFRKNSRVLCVDDIDDEYLRCAAVTNSDGSISVAIINWAEKEKTVDFTVEHNIDKPMRVYEFEADNPTYNEFCDLQDHSSVIESKDSKFKITLKPKSATFLTTDYIDRTPSKIKNIILKNNKLVWNPCDDIEHCYYRVFASSEKNFEPCYENQIASTVAEYKEIDNPNLYYKVVSVDKYGNAGKI